jgi:inosine-uridine nucleoside N-ribohydrolase
MATRMIIDTDPGVDDALALILALRSIDARVDAVTVVGGNVSLDQTTRNAMRVLDLVASNPRPILARGAPAPLRRGPGRAEAIHGKDGLGELERFRDFGGNPRYPEIPVPSGLPHATEVIMELVGRYPDEITLVALGPLTNVAEALRADRTRLLRLRGLVVMGGAIGVPGNVTPAAEFNIHSDPDAAREVFSSGIPVTLVPLDVTRKVTLTREDLAPLGREGSGPTARFIHDATQRALGFMEELEGKASMALHDPLAVAVAIAPSFVETAALHVDVETEGKLTYGMTVADRRPIRNSFKPLPNLKVALEVDAARFLLFFRGRVFPGW